MSAQTRTILFLIADTGAGHRSAANAIQRALAHIERQAAASSGPLVKYRTVIVDAFEECSHFPLRNSVFLYGPAIKYSPRLYGHIYRATNSIERFEAARRICQPFLRQGLRRLIEHVQPDVIVSIHPLLNHITLQVLRDLALRIPFITVVTDLVSIHCAWFARQVTACVVPTATARQLAIGSGVPAKRVHLLGMPIDPKFARQPGKTREEFRAELGLAPNLPVVLLVGGGEGAGGLRTAAEALKWADLPAQLVIITGRNQRLRQELQHDLATFNMPTHLFGFVDNMPTFMRAADVIVTKAGPGTICEALACELPIVLTGAVPGQEEGNIDYVLENEVGVFAPDPEELVATLGALLDPDSSQLAHFRANAQRVRHATASTDIARLILSHVPPALVPSVWAKPVGRVARQHPRSRTQPLRRTISPVLIRGWRQTHRSKSRVFIPPVNLNRYRISGLARMVEVRRLLRRERNAQV